jgi:hypothetical protein
MTAYRRLFRPWLTLAALALALGLDAAVARADHLDDKLNEQAPKIVAALRERHVKNVGVLRFRVKEGDRPESFTSGPLNGNLAVRLENILVMHAGSDDDKDALGIIHNAGLEAARRKVGKWYDDEAEQRRLFAIDSYPLAWGSNKVKADALLTGLVSVASDYREGTVVIEEMHGPGDSKKLVEFSFEVDGALLTDLGKSYSLSKRNREAARTVVKTRDLVADAVKRSNDANNGNPPGGNGNDQPVVNNSADSIEVGGVAFQLLSGGRPVPIKSKDAAKNNGGYQFESPDPAQEILFKITLKGDKAAGVDVKFNGSSLLFEQTQEPANCRVWVLKPEDKYRSYTLKGWYLQTAEGEPMKIAPFKVLTGADAKSWSKNNSQLADKAGSISISVFEEGDQTGSEMLISARGLTSSQEKSARDDRDTLQRTLMKNGHLKWRDVVKRDLIVPDKNSLQDASDSLIKTVNFQRKPVAIGMTTIDILPKATTNNGSDNHPNNGSNNRPNNGSN